MAEPCEMCKSTTLPREAIVLLEQVNLDSIRVARQPDVAVTQLPLAMVCPYCRKAKVQATARAESKAPLSRIRYSLAIECTGCGKPLKPRPSEADWNPL